MNEGRKEHRFDGRLVMLGFGSIGQGVRVRTGLNTRLSRNWNASTGLDIHPHDRTVTSYDVLIGQLPLAGRSGTGH